MRAAPEDRMLSDAEWAGITRDACLADEVETEIVLPKSADP
jgi:hypothetical protein